MKKWTFSKLYLGIEFWTFLKMSKIHFPFYFLVTLFFIFQNRENKEIYKNTCENDESNEYIEAVILF